MCRIIKHGLILCRKKGICRWKIFCPASTYFHKLYGGQDNLTYQTEAQMNGTNAFSIYTNSTDLVDARSARQAVSSVLRFLTRMGNLKYNNHSGYIASVINEYDLLPVKTYDAGFYRHLKNPGDPVFHGDLIAQVIDPYEGEVKSEIYSQTDGIVFFAHTAPMVTGNEVVYKIIRRMHE